MAVGGVGLIAVINADRFGRQLYERWRPQLERTIGRGLGRPLILGSYRGLRPWGLAVGPSRLAAGPRDDSTLEVRGLEVAIDPLASLAQRLPVLRLRGEGAALTLRRNADGRYWVFGGGVGMHPPRLRLKIQLGDSARLAIRPAGLDLQVRGDIGVALDRKSVDGHLRGALPGRGRLGVKGGGNWGRRDLRLNLALREVELAQLASLLPPRRTLVRGRLDGTLDLDRKQGGNGCRGSLRLSGLTVRDPLLPEPLEASRLRLSCSGDELRLASGRWRMANWEGTARAQVAWKRALEVDLTAADPRRGDRLALSARGDWNRPRLRLSGHVPLGRGTPASPAPLNLEAGLSADLRGNPRLDLERLTLRSGRSELTARGAVWPRLDLRTETASFHPSLWSAAPALGSLLGRSETLQGSLQARGTVRTPLLTGRLERRGRTLLSLDAAAGGSRSRPGPLGRITADLAAPGGIQVERTALLGPATARLEWSDDQLRLAEFRSPELQASGSLPLRWQRRRGLVAGDLALGVNLARLSLPRLSPLLGVRMQGELSAGGRLYGPLHGLRPDLQLTVRDPGSGPLQLKETWSGRLTPVGGGGGDLAMASVGPAVPGSLRARLDRAWLPSAATLERRGGTLRFSGTPERYGWQARGLTLEGLHLRLNGEAGPTPLVGLLSGRGVLELQPLAMRGEASVEGAQLWGIQGRRLTAKGTYRQGRFQVGGLLEPKAGGSLVYDLAGSRGGDLRASLEGRKLPLELVTEIATAGSQLKSGQLLPPGRASQLGALLIDTLGGSLQGQLDALDAAREQVASTRAARAEAPPLRREDLRGLIDADVKLSGPDLRRLELEAAAKAHLWIKGQDRDQALAGEPIVLRLEGPLQGGRGGFGLQGVPLSLLALLTPVPSGLRGVLDLDGRYRLGGRGRNGRDRAFRTTIALRDGSINGKPLELVDARVRLEENDLTVRGELRRGGAANGIELTGTIPLDPDREGLRMRISSRGDGLRFVNDLAPGLNWNRGSADLELLVRGSLREPVANGFLRLRGGELNLAGQAIRELEATVLFDFEELVVQEFRARMGERGVLSASGGLGLFQPRPQRTPLRMEVKQARVTVPRLNALTDGQLELQGSLLKPRLTGDLRISRGTVNAQQAPLARPNGNGGVQPVSVQRLVEEKWDFRQPLLLLGPEVESASGQAVRQAVPNFPYLRLSDLKVEIGPDLQVLVPPVATFRTGGRLTLDGPIGPDLTARGVVRLKGGRLTLFTTTFTLDPDAPNVAVFTPSLGLVPYLDIAMRTRVSNSLDLGKQGGVITPIELRGDFTPLDQLNLVRVVVSVSGPADRLGESLVIRSNPPLSQSRLVALIGGNSLAGLSGGNAGAALATVVGQSLLSPLVSGLTDAFGQRFSFAIYPSYVVPTERQTTARTSRRVPSQLVLGTEAGVDLSDRFNFSVLAAPNRSDIPPQGTLRYQASETFGLQGSVDTEGRWQGQLQLFFRF